MNPQEQSNDTFRQIGNLLSGSWELTQRIFESLSYRDVLRARSVCRTWADVGNKILEQRRRLHYITGHSLSSPTTHGKFAFGEASPGTLLEDFFEQIVSRPRYCLAFCSCDWFTHNDWVLYATNSNSSNTDTSKGNVTLSHYLHDSLPASCELGIVCASGVVGTVESRFTRWLQSARHVNQEILSFLCEDGEKEGGKKQGRLRGSSGNNRPCDGAVRNAHHMDDSDGASRPDQLQNTTSKDTDGTVPQSSVGYSIEIERVTFPRQGDAVSLLLVPHHPGFSLKFFNLCDEKLLEDFIDKKCGSISCADFERVTGLTHQDSLKALLLFDAGLDDNFTEAFIQAALARQHHKVALGGGMADYLVTSHSNNTSLHSFGVAVSGPNVTAASIVIPKCVTNPKSLAEYMEELKSCGLPEEQSVAFMFTCCGRGYAWYRRRGNPSSDYHNVETKAFRRIFPNTPVFGFFGGGEIGMTHLPKFSDRCGEEEEEVPYKRRKRKVFHQFSTIIVLLSFL